MCPELTCKIDVLVLHEAVSINLFNLVVNRTLVGSVKLTGSGIVVPPAPAADSTEEKLQVVLTELVSQGYFIGAASPPSSVRALSKNLCHRCLVAHRRGALKFVTNGFLE